MESIEHRALEWLFSRDTGSSSKAIARHMLGFPGCADYPGDADDLGRCLRLLDRIPEWKLRIPEMSEHGRVWQLYVENWHDIIAEYKRRDGSAYALMRELQDLAYKERRASLSGHTEKGGGDG